METELHSGLVLGRLTLIERVSVIQRNGKKRGAWVCSCACGNPNMKPIDAYRIKSGETRSCGCLSREAARANGLQNAGKTYAPRTDLVGQVFGFLEVVAFAGYRQYGERLRCDSNWLAKCLRCGSQREYSRGNLKDPHTLSCGCLSRERASTKMKRRHSEARIRRGLDPNTPISKQHTILRSITADFRRAVLRRDNFTCQLCTNPKPGGKLHVHHCVRVADDLTRLIDPYNVITLCEECHRIKAHAGNTRKLPDPTLQVELLRIAARQEQQLSVLVLYGHPEYKLLQDAVLRGILECSTKIV